MNQEPTSGMKRSTFVQRFGDLYERSPWVAEAVYDSGLSPAHDTLEGLHQLFCQTMLAASRERQLALIRAHPQLAGLAARRGQLTKASLDEQRSAGLDRLEALERERLEMLNLAYREKFGIPFILAVKGLEREDIMDNLERRLVNTPEQEFANALDQINRIALLRLRAR